ncbi:MAG TPA: hypothetical protein VK437_16620 [Steroidobacteraceae bacterium]|nr:hypothetical protein [Steroidobacteraceae bacterium]
MAVLKARCAGRARPAKWAAAAWLCACCIFGLCSLSPPMSMADIPPTDEAKAQWAEYAAVEPKTILALQPFRQASRIDLTALGPTLQSAALINLNPQINAWFVLTVRASGAEPEASFHIENPDPMGRRITLSASYPQGLRISAGGRSFDCPLWSGGNLRPLEEARASALPYAPICDNQLFIRNAVPGTYTNLERITDFLRDRVWGGDKIVAFVREELYKDVFIEQGQPGTRSVPPASATEGPARASVGDEFAQASVQPAHLEIALAAGALQEGSWYPVADIPGVFLSVIEPRAIAPSILETYRESVNSLDAVESSALDYLVAFDLSRFDIAFALGTDHPRIGWSEHAPEAMRDPRLPGPDGVGQASPLVRTGMVNPSLVSRTVATFAGGFKREHGAFRTGPLAERNHASHYGFIEQGAIFSKLQPGLATLIVTDARTVEMKTWASEDDALLAHLKFARQNGVPLIEAAAGGPHPGEFVNRWGPGNWSGSSEEHLRTLRAGICLQETGDARYLIYGYFSDATPSAMARVFQAYRCGYAMHLDMNALEHTYLALYTLKSGKMVVQHLIEGMSEVDRKGGDRLSPRFIGFPDDRDFFYVLRKEPAP